MGTKEFETFTTGRSKTIKKESENKEMKMNQHLTAMEQSDLAFECLMDLDNVLTLNNSICKFMEYEEEQDEPFKAFLGAKLDNIRNLNNIQRDYIERLNNNLNKLETCINLLLKEEKEKAEQLERESKKAE